MTDRDNQEYYARRAARAKELAEKAAEPSIRKIHTDMAASYESLAIGNGRPTLRISL